MPPPLSEENQLNLGARMTDSDSPTQIQAGSEATRIKGGKGKAVIKRSKGQSLHANKQNRWKPRASPIGNRTCEEPVRRHHGTRT